MGLSTKQMIFLTPLLVAISLTSARVHPYSNPIQTIIADQLKAQQSLLCVAPTAQCTADFLADPTLKQYKDEFDLLKQDLTTALRQALSQPLHRTSCDVATGKLQTTTHADHAESPSLQESLQRLSSLSYLPLLSVIEANALEHALNNAGNAPKALRQACKAYQMQSEFLNCSRELKLPVDATAAKNCLSIISRSKVGDVFIIEAAERLVRFLPDVSPFIEKEITQHLSSLKAAENDIESLAAVIDEALQESLKAYLKWEVSKSIIMQMAEQDKFLLKTLGLSKSELQDLAKLVSGDALKTAAEAVESDIEQYYHQQQLALINALETRVNAMADKLVNAMEQEAKAWEKKLTRQAQGFIVEQALTPVKDVLGDIGLTMAFEQEKNTIKGRTAYTASFYYQKPTSAVTFDVKCEAGKNNCQEKYKAAKSLDTGTAFEKIELGIYLDNIGIDRTADSNEYIYQYLGKNLRANTRIDDEKFRAALKRLGLPEVIDLQDVTITAKNNLKDITVLVPVKVLGLRSNKPLSLSLLKDGRPQAPTKAIKAFVEDSAQDVLRSAIASTLEKLPYVVGSAQQLDLPFGMVLDSSAIALEYDLALRRINATAAFELHNGQQVLGNVPLALRLDEKGLHFSKVSIDASVRTALTQQMERYVRTLMPEVFEYVDQISPIIRDKHLSFDVYFSGEILGCRIHDIQANLRYPFDDLKKQLASGLDQLQQRALDCAEQEAIKRAWGSVPALDFSEPLHLFGMEFRYLSHERIDTTNYMVDIQASLADKTLSISQLPLAYKDGKISVRLDKASYKSEELREYLRSLMQPLIAIVPDQLVIEKVGMDKGGMYFYSRLKNVPYIGDLNLGKVFIKGFEKNLETTLVNAARRNIIKVLKTTLQENIDIPDIGPIQDLQPNIRGDKKLVIGLSGKLRIYDGLLLPLEVDLLPGPVKVHPPKVDDAITQSLLGAVTQLVPTQLGGFKLTSTPSFVKLPEHDQYGLTFGAEIDLGFLTITFERIGISAKGVVLPDEIGGALPADIQLGYVVISKAGITYNTKTSGLKITGDITALQSALANVAKIQSKLDLTDIGQARFLLEGNLIVANSLSVLRAEGEVALKEARVAYDARTNASFKSIVQARAQGLIDGKAQIFSTTSSLSLLGLKLSETDFLVNVQQDQVYFKGGERLLIGWADFGVQTNTKFKNPTAKANFAVDLAGWKALDASMDVSMVLAKLQMKALGIKVTVITSSVKTITPKMLLKILANLLKVDISSLLKMKLKDITISYLDNQGNISEVSSGDSGDEQSQSGGAQGGDEQKNTDRETTKKPKNPDDKTGGESSSGGSTIGDVNGNNYCLPIAGKRYTYEFVQQGRTKPRYNKHDLDRKLSFDQEAKKVLCGKDDVVDNHWVEVHKSNRQYGQGCDEQVGRLNYEIGRVNDKYAPKAEKNLFCGHITRPLPKCYKRERLFNKIDSLSTKEYRKLVAERAELGQHDNPDLIYNPYGYFYSTPSEENFYQKTLEKLYKGYRKQDICGWVETIRISYKYKKVAFGLLGGSYHVNAEVLFEPIDANYDWQQHYKLFYHTNERKFYTLSSCVSPQALEKQKYSITPFHTKVCDKGMIPLVNIASYEGQAKDKKIILTNADEYYLIDEIAATITETGKTPDKKPRPFDFTLSDSRYRGSEFLPSPGVRSKSYYINKTTGKSLQDFTFSIHKDNPLYPWFDEKLFREELIAYYPQYKNLSIWHSDETKKQLVLKASQQNDALITTLWLRKGKIPLQVDIDLSNPYRSNFSLNTPEKKRLVHAIYDDVINWKRDSLKISLGLDRKQELELLTLSDAEDFSLLMVKSSDNILSNHESFKTNRRRVNGTKMAFQKCLDRFNVNVSVEQLFKSPGKYYLKNSPDKYPLKLLDLAVCL